MCTYMYIRTGNQTHDLLFIIRRQITVYTTPPVFFKNILPRYADVYVRNSNISPFVGKHVIF
jgi:hypothetical protein